MTDGDGLTAAVLAVPGVRGIVPDRSVTSAAMAAIRARPQDSEAVRLHTTGGVQRIRIRIVADRAVPSATVIAGITHAVGTAFPGAPVELRIEIAQVD